MQLQMFSFKNNAVSISLLLCVIACSPENSFVQHNNQTTKLQESFLKASELHSFDVQEGAEVVGSEGTVLKFPASIFEYDDGVEVTGEVTIELKEFYSCYDMLLNGLSTISEDRLLETGGMLFCDATSKGRNVRIKRGESYTISFLTRTDKKSADMYLFNRTDENDYWELEGDTIRDTNFGLSRFFEEDTIVAPDEISRLKEEYEQSLEYYVFESSSLGWKNCDRFVSPLEEAEEMIVNVDTMLRPVVRLVYREYNSISPGYLQPDRRIKFHPLAVRQEATLFGFSKVNEKIYMAQKDILITTNMAVVNLEFKEASLEDLKETAKSLEWEPI